MRNMTERRAVELSWCEVCGIASAEIEEILGLHIQCRTDVTGTEFGALTFEGCSLPLPKLCLILQAVQATPDDWEDALPVDGETCVGAIGMAQAEKLIGRHLKLSWKHRLITADGLWLVGVSDFQEAKPGSTDSSGSILPNELVRTIIDTADCLRRREGR